ncbi:hypothetical protein [Streptomyces sp. NPDC056169]|uniref:hypothetical protein n=1 Tax=Streptomyces sp. NPDC056169 TaxID=3345734 RepID=UPI0035DCDD04
MIGSDTDTVPQNIAKELEVLRVSVHMLDTTFEDDTDGLEKGSDALDEVVSCLEERIQTLTDIVERLEGR